MTAAAAKSLSADEAAPDLSYFRTRYPLTVAQFGRLPDREAWLRRVWETDARWQESPARRGTGSANGAAETVVRGAPPAQLPIEGEFEAIYAGGSVGLLHGAALAVRYGRRVLVFDPQRLGEAQRDWNLSDEELRDLAQAGLFSKEELERAVVNRYRAGFAKFHDAGSRVKTPPLWMNGVLDVALAADGLLRLAAARLRERGGALLDGWRLVRCYVERERVTVELEDGRGARKLFAARLLVDATGASSALARQLNEGQALTHVCPTVGTIAQGFARGPESNQVDFGVGEILVSTEDARDHRQLIWEGLAGAPARDEYATYLFFYDAVDSPADKSLLALFERYFESLPQYKRAGAHWRVVKPVFGYLPVRSWRGRARRAAAERVMLLGEAAGLSSPLTFCGFGSHARNLRRVAHLTELALQADALDAGSLAEIAAYEPRVAQMASLAELLRPTPKGAPAAVNETLNAVMAALHGLDERVRRELFQDRMSLGALKSLLGRTVKLYPRILQRVREHLGARGAFWWAAALAEAALKERREQASATVAPPLALEEEREEAARREFARYLSLYKNTAGAAARSIAVPEAATTATTRPERETSQSAQ